MFHTKQNKSIYNERRDGGGEAINLPFLAILRTVRPHMKNA